MAHYAFIDNNNIVVDVIVGRDENDLKHLPEGFNNWERFYTEERGLRCLRTSINTVAGKHLRGKTPFRFNAASIGGVYDEERDAFIGPPPQLNPSFVLDDETLVWVPPEPFPDDGFIYNWDEQVQTWFRPANGPSEPAPGPLAEWAWDFHEQEWVQRPEPLSELGLLSKN